MYQNDKRTYCACKSTAFSLQIGTFLAFSVSLSLSLLKVPILKVFK